MRRVIACMVVMVVLAPTLAQSQTSVSQVLHINTSDVARYLELRPRPRSSPIPRGPVLIDDEPHPTLPPMNSTELRQHMEASLWKLFDAADSLSLDRATLINALAAAGIRGPAQGLPGADTGQAPPGL